MDRHRLGALLLTAVGIGFWCFLPECVVAIRYGFVAFAVALSLWDCRRFRNVPARWIVPIGAAAALSAIFFFQVETGAMIALVGSFAFVFLSVFRPMMESKEKFTCAAMGAAAIAALIFGITVGVKCPRLNLYECQMYFSLAAFAGALTLLLRPLDRRKTK